MTLRTSRVVLMLFLPHATMPRRRCQLSGNLLATFGILALQWAQMSIAHAQDAELAKKLSNPVSSLISVPFQSNYDRGIGPDGEGEKFYVNFQPVVPISLGPDWTVVSRTIVPIVNQDEIFPGSGDQFGLGDTLQSLFFTPKSPGPSGIIWGVGPAILLPTATDDLLGGEKWGAGPTGVVLKQSGPWTYGVLANHIWSFAGDNARADISNTFIQPFVSYTTADAWTYGVNLESAYTWIDDVWSVPLNLTASKLTKIGDQPVSIGGGVRYWLTSPDAGPEGFGARLSVTFLYPTK